MQKYAFLTIVFLFSVFIVILSCTATAAGSGHGFALPGAGSPDNNSIKSLSGSHVIFYPAVGGDECYIPGIAQDFIFRAESFTNDWEFALGIFLHFPDGWIVNHAEIYGVPACSNGGTFGAFNVYIQDPPNTVIIQHYRQHSSTDHCAAYYIVNAVPSEGIEDAIVSWYWWGDGYGSGPYHPCSNDGYTPPGQTECDEQLYPPAYIPACAFDPGIYFFPSEQTREGCKGTALEYELTIMNRTGISDTFSFDYNVLTGNGNLSGPSHLTLNDEEDLIFTVYLTGNPSLEAGDIVMALINATGDGYSNSAGIIKEIILGEWHDIAIEPHQGRADNAAVAYNGHIWSIAGYGSEHSVRYYSPSEDLWTTIPDSQFINCSPMSGASYGNKAFIYGDAKTSGFTGLWSYNMDTNTWTNESPPGPPPPYTGIWAPAWVSDPETGILYITGGATTPGGGNLSTVYVYDAENNTWLDPLPDFTTQRAFHASWIFTHPATGNKMLAVAGGVNSSSVVFSSTQCYDFATGTWNAENADIPPLSRGWWGMGYTSNYTQESHQLWLIGGADHGFALLPAISEYYDLSQGTWVDGGVYHESAVYRSSAVSMDGQVYKIGGATSGFNPTGFASRYSFCPAPPQQYLVSIEIIPEDIYVYANPCGSGCYTAGETVQVSVNEVEGYDFTGWTSEPEVSFSDPAELLTAFTMPEEDIALSASYELSLLGPDAAIYSSGITYSPEYPKPGDILEITARVHNIGDTPVISGMALLSYSLAAETDLQLIDEIAFGGIEPSQYIDITAFWDTGPDTDPRQYLLTVALEDITPDDIDPSNNIAIRDIPFPVELDFFTAHGIYNKANIKWQTLSETDNLGFNLYRLRGDKVSPFISYVPIKLNTSIIHGEGSPSDPYLYSYTDYVKNGGNYFYILECISISGSVTDIFKTRLQWFF